MKIPGFMKKTEPFITPVCASPYFPFEWISQKRANYQNGEQPVRIFSTLRTQQVYDMPVCLMS